MTRRTRSALPSTHTQRKEQHGDLVRVQINDTTYGIFDTFENEHGRQAHLNGQIPAALGQVGPDLLAADPDIRPLDIIATK